MLRKLIIRVEALSFRQFALSFLAVYILFYHLLLLVFSFAGHTVNTIRIHTALSAGSRPKLTYLINEIIMESLDTLGVFYVHGLFAVLTYFAAFFILRKIRASNVYLLIFSVFLFSHILWQEEVFAVRDTILFGLFLTVFFALIVSDLSLVKRFLLLGLVSGLGWLTRATGIIFIPMIFIVPMTIPSHSFRQKIYGLLLCLSAFCITISPWQIQHLRKTGDIAFSSWPGNGIYNCVKGNNSLSADIYPYIDFDLIEETLKEHVFDDKNMTLKPVYTFISEHPWRFAWLKIKNTLLFPLPIQIPLGGGDYNFTNNKIIISNFYFHHIYRIPIILFNCLPLIIFVLYLCYFIKPAKLQKTEKEIYFKKMLFIMSFIYFIPHLIVWYETRLVLPVHPLWFLCAAIYAGDRCLPLLVLKDSVSRE